MGKASSAKKIKRVQQAGVSRAPGQRRQMSYPVLIGGIVVLGLVLVFFAYQSRTSTNEEAPTTSDSWVDAWGVNICGEFQDTLTNVTPDTTGIDIHDDGLIHIDPKNAENAGKNAVFGKFAQSVGIQVTDGQMTMPDGTIKKDGDKCGEDDGRVALYVWPPQANENTEPRIVTKNINSIPFTDDGQIFVLAFEPRSTEPKLPPTVAKLSNPDNSEPKRTSTTTTTAPGGDATTSTAPTTAPAGG